MARETILVVDEERHSGELAQLYLEQADFCVESASSAGVSSAC